MNVASFRHTIGDRIREERIARREDYFLGPLAPRRDAGKDENELATVSTLEHSGLGLGKEKFARGARMEKGQRLGKGRERERRKWIPWEECLVEVGDRVVVVGGVGPEIRDKGRIGVVKDVRKRDGTVLVEGFNEVSKIL